MTSDVDKVIALSEDDLNSSNVMGLKKFADKYWQLIPQYFHLGDEEGDVVVKAMVGQLAEIRKARRQRDALRLASRALLGTLRNRTPTRTSVPFSKIDIFTLDQKLLLEWEVRACDRMETKTYGEKNKGSKVEIIGVEKVKKGICKDGFCKVTLDYKDNVPLVDVNVHCYIVLRGFKNDLYGIVVAMKNSQVVVLIRETRAVLNKVKDLVKDLVMEKTDKSNIYQKLNRAIGNILKPNDHCRDLRDVLFGLKDLDGFVPLNTSIKYMNTNLDTRQRDIVNYVMERKKLSIIHGPPGTGKTTTVVEVILQTILDGTKVLVTAPSDTAVDNILEKLLFFKPDGKGKFIRIGKPSNVRESLQGFTLNAAIKEKSDNARKDALLNAEVVLSTLIECSPAGPIKLLPIKHFGLTVIDDCTEALEAECWIVVPRAPRLLLAGDDQQRPPIVYCEDYMARRNLSISLMERYIMSDRRGVVNLVVQYRMNKRIMQWSSDTFYDGALYASPAVSDQTLAQLPGVHPIEGLNDTIVLVDTASCGLGQSLGGSIYIEMKIVDCIVRKLISSGIAAKDVGVVIAYSKQVEFPEINNLCAEFQELEIKSIYDFLRKEKEVIILVLGSHLDERRLLNVAVTRAKRQLIVVCDSGTVGKDEFLGEFLAYLSSNGSVKRAEDLKDIIDPSVFLSPIVEETLTSEAHTASETRSTSDGRFKMEESKTFSPYRRVGSRAWGEGARGGMC